MTSMPGMVWTTGRTDQQWEDFPSVSGTVNGSLKAEFQAFQRQLVTNFLAWQVVPDQRV
jgi:hypothetical protein